MSDTYQLKQQCAAESILLHADTNLLITCLNAGLPVARSCRNGNCGRCDVQLLAGQVVLRTGEHCQAPTQIPLCLAQPLSDLLVDRLPLETRTQHWQCQVIDGGRLRLPAGKQTPPRPGDIVAVFPKQQTGVAPAGLNTVAEQRGREIALADPVLTSSPTVGLLVIDQQWQGNYALWQTRPAPALCLWSGINADTAHSALSLLQRGAGQFEVRETNIGNTTK
jgi:ferredoxin